MIGTYAMVLTVFLVKFIYGSMGFRIPEKNIRAKEKTGKILIIGKN